MVHYTSHSPTLVGERRNAREEFSKLRMRIFINFCINIALGVQELESIVQHCAEPPTCTKQSCRRYWSSQL